MLYMHLLKRVNPKGSHHNEKNGFFPYFFNFVSIWDDVYSTYCDHFMMYVSQISMLYTLNITVLYVNYISIKLPEKILLTKVKWIHKNNKVWAFAVGGQKLLQSILISWTRSNVGWCRDTEIDQSTMESKWQQKNIQIRTQEDSPTVLS